MYAPHHDTIIHVDLRTSRPAPWVRANGYMPGTVLCLTLRDSSVLMWVLQRHLQKKEGNSKSVSGPSCLFTLWFCHVHWHSWLRGENSLLWFCPDPFPNEIGLNPLPPILNRLRLETNYELMIWSLNVCIISVHNVILSHQYAMCINTTVSRALMLKYIDERDNQEQHFFSFSRTCGNNH